MDTFKSEVIAGLRESPKRIPSKFFYDERGSQLFEAITELDEYYLTRTEISILKKDLSAMTARIGPDATVIEFGTGAGVKTKMLLEALERPSTYIPIDISREQLWPRFGGTFCIVPTPRNSSDLCRLHERDLTADRNRFRKERHILSRLDDWEFYS